MNTIRSFIYIRARVFGEDDGSRQGRRNDGAKKTL